MGVGSVWKLGEQAVAGGHDERVEREPVTGVWGQSPQRGPGAELLVEGSVGEAPWSWNTCLLYTSDAADE